MAKKTMVRRTKAQEKGVINDCAKCVHGEYATGTKSLHCMTRAIDKDNLTEASRVEKAENCWLYCEK